MGAQLSTAALLRGELAMTAVKVSGAQLTVRRGVVRATVGPGRGFVVQTRHGSVLPSVSLTLPSPRIRTL